MPKFCICITQFSEYASILMSNAWINCSNCSDYGRVEDMPGQGFSGFLICFQLKNVRGLEYGKDVNIQGLERLLKPREGE